jgi:hypothetical protein
MSVRIMRTVFLLCERVYVIKLKFACQEVAVEVAVDADISNQPQGGY